MKYPKENLASDINIAINTLPLVVRHKIFRNDWVLLIIIEPPQPHMKKDEENAYPIAVRLTYTTHTTVSTVIHVKRVNLIQKIAKTTIQVVHWLLQ
jgi:hypothetical protein